MFTFFRKKQTILNADKQWEQIEEYYLSLPSKLASPISWEEAEKQFDTWLEALS
ncbi:MAG: hypothetical protein AAF824_06505 [Bacteroidota bacterium]